MKQVTTYVGVHAHQKDLFIAMLIGDRTAPVTWQVANEPPAVRRLVRKLERVAPGSRARVLRSPGRPGMRWSGSCRRAPKIAVAIARELAGFCGLRCNRCPAP